jgi:hypothetical protein
LDAQLDKLRNRFNVDSESEDTGRARVRHDPAFLKALARRVLRF